jgi:hypothetical protein
MIGNALRKGGMATLLLALCLMARAQLPPLHQVQAVVDGLRSPEQAAYAQEHLRAVAGVRVARVDHNTRNLMLQVDAACGINADDLGAVLQPLGLGIRCFGRRPIGPGAFHHLDPRTCDRPTLETR